MSKSASADPAAGTARERLTARKGTAGSVGAKAGGAKLIDPAVRRALQKEDTAPLTVMVKFDPKNSSFGRFPVTNRPGSARERAFSEELTTEVRSAAASGQYRIVSTAANIGVATVEASAGIVRDLLRSSKVTGMKLKAG